MKDYFEGLGVTRRELEPGTAVMVPVGRISAAVNGQPCIVAWAVVRGPGPDENTHWLDVYTIPGGPPLPQMYQWGEILGVPALGLSMDGAPLPDVVTREE